MPSPETESEGAATTGYDPASQAISAEVTEPFDPEKYMPRVPWHPNVPRAWPLLESWPTLRLAQPYTKALVNDTSAAFYSKQ